MFLNYLINTLNFILDTKAPFPFYSKKTQSHTHLFHSHNCILLLNTIGNCGTKSARLNSHLKLLILYLFHSINEINSTHPS